MTPSQYRVGRFWILLVLLATSCRHLDLDMSSKPPAPPTDETKSIDDVANPTPKSTGETKQAPPAAAKPAADEKSTVKPQAKSPVFTTTQSSPAAMFDPPPPPSAATAKPAGASPVALAQASDGPPKRPKAHSADDANDDLERRLTRIGIKLAQVNPSASIRFQFETLRNPRPRINHTPDGHVYMTDGMLKEISNDGELAGILALEMSEMIHEVRRESPAYRKQAATPDAPLSTAEVDALAKQLLDHAGFPSSSLTALRERVRKLELASKPKENYRPLGPAMAN
jgi:hypothetical protein